MITAQCPHCKYHIRGDDRYAGQVVGCPKCKKPVPMPIMAKELPPQVLEFDPATESVEEAESTASALSFLSETSQEASRTSHTTYSLAGADRELISWLARYKTCKTCKSDTPLSHFFFGSTRGFLTCLAIGFVLFFAELVGTVPVSKWNQVDPLGTICVLVICLGAPLGGWVIGLAHYASDGSSVQCPRCGKLFAAVTLASNATQLGESIEIRPWKKRITNADGSYGGYVEDWMPVKVTTVAERCKLICKFCGSTWDKGSVSKLLS